MGYSRVLPEGRLVHDDLALCVDTDGTKPCHYCGQPADTEDHVLPQTIAEQVGAVDPTLLAALHAPFGDTRTVPACRECNSLLGPRYDRNLSSRKARLKSILRRRYKGLLTMPEWPLSDLRELEGGLLRFVEARVVQREIVRARIDW